MAAPDSSETSALRSAIWAIRSILGLRRSAPDDGAPTPCPASNAWVLENRFARWHARRIIGHLDIRKGMRVLDVGCGVGRFTLPLAASVGADGEVVALDLQFEMLERLKDNAAAAGVSNIITVEGGAGEGKLPSEKFDRVLMASVLGEIPPNKRAEALRETRQVLEPDGILYVVEVARFDPDYLAVQIVEELVSECGFSATKVTRIWPAYLLPCQVERE